MSYKFACSFGFCNYCFDTPLKIMKNTDFGLAGLLCLALLSSAYSAEKDPETKEELAKFCDAPDYEKKLKAMDEKRRRKLADACFTLNTFEKSPPRSWGIGAAERIPQR